LLDPEEGTNHTTNSTHDTVMKAASITLPLVEAAIASILVFQFLFSKVIEKMIVDVLEEKGWYEKLRVRNDWRDIPKVSGPPSCIFMTLTLLVLVCSLPLNFVIIIGQVLFVFANGWVGTWSTMSTFLPLIGYQSLGSQLKHVLCHPISYLCFGAVSFAFSLIPLGSVITAGGVACGSAMFFGGFVDEGRNGPDEIPKSELGYNLVDKALVMDDIQAELQPKTAGRGAGRTSTEERRKQHQEIPLPKAVEVSDKSSIEPTKAKAAELAAGITETVRPYLDKAKPHISKAEEMISKKAPKLAPVAGFVKGALFQVTERDRDVEKGGLRAGASE